MKNLTKKQEAERDEFLNKMVQSGKLTQEAVDRVMSDPTMRQAINALIAK